MSKSVQRRHGKRHLGWTGRQATIVDHRPAADRLKLRALLLQAHAQGGYVYRKPGQPWSIGFYDAPATDRSRLF